MGKKLGLMGIGGRWSCCRVWRGVGGVGSLGSDRLFPSDKIVNQESGGNIWKGRAIANFPQIYLESG